MPAFGNNKQQQNQVLWGRRNETSGHARCAFIAADVAPAIRFDRGRRGADVAAAYDRGARRHLSQPRHHSHRAGVGAQTAAKAEPDGYTLLVVLAPLAQNIAIYREPGFSLEKDFVPIAHMASVDLVIAAGKKLPINNFDEFLAYTKANPGKISCGSQSPPQMQYLMKTTGINMTVAPYKGSALITNDLIGGQIDVGLVPYSDIAQHVAAGTAKVLFTNGPKRVRQLPDVQAVGERFPGFYFWSWYGIAAPAKTPAAVVEKLRKELVTLAKSPDFVAFVTKLGLAPVDEPGKFGEVISKEIAQWQRLVVDLQPPPI